MDPTTAYPVISNFLFFDRFHVSVGSSQHEVVREFKKALEDPRVVEGFNTMLSELGVDKARVLEAMEPALVPLDEFLTSQFMYQAMFVVRPGEEAVVGEAVVDEPFRGFTRLEQFEAWVRDQIDAWPVNTSKYFYSTWTGHSIGIVVHKADAGFDVYMINTGEGASFFGSTIETAGDDQYAFINGIVRYRQQPTTKVARMLLLNSLILAEMSFKTHGEQPSQPLTNAASYYTIMARSFDNDPEVVMALPPQKTGDCTFKSFIYSMLAVIVTEKGSDADVAVIRRRFHLWLFRWFTVVAKAYVDKYALSEATIAIHNFNTEHYIRMLNIMGGAPDRHADSYMLPYSSVDTKFVSLPPAPPFSRNHYSEGAKGPDTVKIVEMVQRNLIVPDDTQGEHVLIPSFKRFLKEVGSGSLKYLVYAMNMAKKAQSAAALVHYQKLLTDVADAFHKYALALSRIPTASFTDYRDLLQFVTMFEDLATGLGDKAIVWTAATLIVLTLKHREWQGIVGADDGRDVKHNAVDMFMDCVAGLTMPTSIHTRIIRSMFERIVELGMFLPLADLQNVAAADVDGMELSAETKLAYMRSFVERVVQRDHQPAAMAFLNRHQTNLAGIPNYHTPFLVYHNIKIPDDKRSLPKHDLAKIAPVSIFLHCLTSVIDFVATKNNPNKQAFVVGSLIMVKIKDGVISFNLLVDELVKQAVNSGTMNWRMQYSQDVHVYASCVRSGTMPKIKEYLSANVEPFDLQNRYMRMGSGVTGFKETHSNMPTGTAIVEVDAGRSFFKQRPLVTREEMYELMDMVMAGWVFMDREERLFNLLYMFDFLDYLDGTEATQTSLPTAVREGCEEVIKAFDKHPPTAQIVKDGLFRFQYYIDDWDIVARQPATTPGDIGTIKSGKGIKYENTVFYPQKDSTYTMSAKRGIPEMMPAIITRISRKRFEQVDHVEAFKGILDILDSHTYEEVTPGFWRERNTFRPRMLYSKQAPQNAAPSKRVCPMSYPLAFYFEWRLDESGKKYVASPSHAALKDDFLYYDVECGIGATTCRMSNKEGYELWTWNGSDDSMFAAQPLNVQNLLRCLWVTFPMEQMLLWNHSGRLRLLDVPCCKLRFEVEGDTVTCNHYEVVFGGPGSLHHGNHVLLLKKKDAYSLLVMPVDAHARPSHEFGAFDPHNIYPAQIIPYHYTNEFVVPYDKDTALALVIAFLLDRRIVPLVHHMHMCEVFFRPGSLPETTATMAAYMYNLVNRLTNDLPLLHTVRYALLNNFYQISRLKNDPSDWMMVYARSSYTHGSYTVLDLTNKDGRSVASAELSLTDAWMVLANLPEYEQPLYTSLKFQPVTIHPKDQRQVHHLPSVVDLVGTAATAKPQPHTLSLVHYAMISRGHFANLLKSLLTRVTAAGPEAGLPKTTTMAQRTLMIFYQAVVGMLLNDRQHNMVNGILGSFGIGVARPPTIDAMLMGGGKTKMVTPLAILSILQLRPGANIALVTPPKLRTQSIEFLRMYLMGFCGARVVDTLAGAGGGSVAVITDHDMKKSVLRSYEHGNPYSKAYCIFDEFHLICDPLTSELNMPVTGAKDTSTLQWIGEELNDLWNMFQVLMEDRIYNVPGYERLFSAAVSHNVAQRTAKQAIDALMERKAYSSGVVRDAADIAKTGDTSPFATRKWSADNVRRTFLYYHVFKLLPHMLTVQNRRDYGLIPEKIMCVPFSHADVPDKTSTFSDIILNVCQTIVAISQDRLRLEHLRLLVNAVKEEMHAYHDKRRCPRYQELDVIVRWLSDAPPLAAVLTDEAALPNLLDALHEESNVRGLRAIKKMMACVLIPRELHYDERIFNTSGAELFLAGNHARRAGFTGTALRLPFVDCTGDALQIEDQHPEDARQLRGALEHVAMDESTDGGAERTRYASYMKYEKPRRNILLDNVVASIAWNKASALIDVGSHLAGVTPLELLQELCRVEVMGRGGTKGPLKDAVAYWDEKDRLMVIRCDDLTPRPFGDGAAADNVLVFYDNAHTTGTDLALEKDAVGIVTVSPTTTYTMFVQGLFRMRKIAHGQRAKVLCDYVIPGPLVFRNLYNMLHDNEKRYRQRQLSRFNMQLVLGNIRLEKKRRALRHDRTFSRSEDSVAEDTMKRLREIPAMPNEFRVPKQLEDIVESPLQTMMASYVRYVRRNMPRLCQSNLLKSLTDVEHVFVASTNTNENTNVNTTQQHYRSDTYVDAETKVSDLCQPVNFYQDWIRFTSHANKFTIHFSPSLCNQHTFFSSVPPEHPYHKGSIVFQECILVLVSYRTGKPVVLSVTHREAEMLMDFLEGEGGAPLLAANKVTEVCLLSNIGKILKWYGSAEELLPATLLHQQHLIMDLLPRSGASQTGTLLANLCRSMNAAVELPDSPEGIAWLADVVGTHGYHLDKLVISDMHRKHAVKLIVACQNMATSMSADQFKQAVRDLCDTLLDERYDDFQALLYRLDYGALDLYKLKATYALLKR